MATHAWIDNLHERVESRILRLHTQEYRRELLSHVHIDYDAFHQVYRGRLYEYRVAHECPERDMNYGVDVDIRQMLTEQLIHRYMESTEMADAALAIDVPIPPQFTVQQNTQTNDLRELRRSYPTDIFNYNWNVPVIQALRDERNQVREALNELARMKTLLHALHNTPDKYLKHMRGIISAHISSRQLREMDDTGGDPTRLNTYHTAMSSIQHYRERRASFHANKVEYGRAQAQYNQRAAMIRQKPSIPRTVDVQRIAEVVSQWDKVWGVAVKRSTEGGLIMRIGLCNIVMEESAVETVYDDPMPITLAPFYFTITLHEDGSFVCRSSQNHTAGLSGGGNNPGGVDYDMHPHQLSDTPCFGTFGQSFINMAGQGDMIALISGIIAFYSQYNSEDSAGVNARAYHPSMIYPMEDSGDYTSRLHDRFIQWNFNTCDREKLIGAVADYCRYHETERDNPAPLRLSLRRCWSCEDADVSDDGGEYYNTAGGERVCYSCWEDHFCAECERHVEDCECSGDEY